VSSEDINAGSAGKRQGRASKSARRRERQAQRTGGGGAANQPPPQVEVPHVRVSNPSLILTFVTTASGLLAALGVTKEMIIGGVHRSLAEDPTRVVYLLAAVALVGLGLFFYDRAKERASRTQAQLIRTAADQTSATVRLVKQ
jgi:hypothetical protein